MCGIVGAVTTDPMDRPVFEAMLDELAHRGPDGRGIYATDDGTTLLGARRLSIIDPTDAGDMPLTNEDGSRWIVFNGEVYNHPALRERLLERGHEFASGTDTEVILHAYEEWGVDCVDRFRGMFAFAIWDEDAERLFCARDRLGIKPFYYHRGDDRLVFASEVKALVEDQTIPLEIDPGAVRDFFVYRYVPAPRSIWSAIRKLPPGHYLVDDDEGFRLVEYWNLEGAVAEAEATGDPAERVEALLDDAVAEHLVSDVPLSVLLSGGLDSSLVTAFTARHADETHTYSLGFEGTDDELPYARIVAEAFDTAHTERVLESADMDELADRLAYVYDEPIGDSSVFPTFVIMEAIAEEFKVALSGDGGDEVFAGYDWYARHRRYQRSQWLSPIANVLRRVIDSVPERLDNQYLDAVRSRLEPFAMTGLDRYRHLMAPRFSPDEAGQLLGGSLAMDTDGLDDPLEGRFPADEATVTDLQRFDAQSFLVDDILVKVDRASMANSLEVRVPFLDHRLVAYALALDEETVFDAGEQKHLLKRVASTLLPDAILQRGKRGFSAPLDELGFIQDNLDLLWHSLAAADGVLDRGAIEAQLATATGSARDQAKLWLLIAFELWYREWRPVERGSDARRG